LFDPFWAAHAAHEFGCDPDFAAWPLQYGWWLNARAQFIKPFPNSVPAAVKVEAQTESTYR
jgi:hypothetical protein